MDLILALAQIRLPQFLSAGNSRIPKKTINDLKENDFIAFFIEDETVVARLIGVFRPVSHSEFILEKHPTTVSDISLRRIYQVQKDEKGGLFLQGAKESFNYNFKNREE